MDIKLKKIKGIIGFAAFFLGVTLLVEGTLGMVYDVIGNNRYNAPAYSMDKADFQELPEFRDFVTSRLENFLDMATGAPINSGYWGYYGDYRYDFDAEEGTSEVTEGIASTGQAVISDDWSDNENWEGYEDREERNLSPEKIKKMADKLHESIKMDKNMLYSICYDGKELYTNTEGKQLDKTASTMPDGYNFLLHFDGTRVKIVKDGQEQDIYGDGYYRETSAWYVPGYNNFTVDEGTSRATVTIAVAKEPLLYSYGQYGKSSYRQSDGMLYWLDSNCRQVQQERKADVGCMIAGIVLLAVYVLLRRDKKLADQAIARVTGRVWFEAKLLIFLGIGLGVVYIGGNVLADRGFWYYSTEVIQEWTYMVEGGTASSVSGLGRIFLMDILSAPACFILLFWCLYFIINDCRRNKQVWKHGLIYKGAVMLRARGMKLPLSKRMIQRCRPVFVSWAVFAAAALVLAVCVDLDLMGYPGILTLCFLLMTVLTAVFLWRHMKGIEKLARDMDTMADRITAIRNGDYDGKNEMPADSDLCRMAEELEDIRHGMTEAVEEQMKSERMKVELIANVSHDIKTPLTSIISYVEFLKREENLPEHVKDYIRILDEKSIRLKTMIQDVFAVSKAASGELPVSMEVLDFGKLLTQTMADMDEQIQQSSVQLKVDIPSHPVLIEADGQRMYRVFQNLIQNALRYSLEGSRVFITLKEDASMAVASVKNTSRYEIDHSKDYSERFTRGDESRTDGGSGLGLSIAQSFTEACGGSFRLEAIADLFVVTVSFVRVRENGEGSGS